MYRLTAIAAVFGSLSLAAAPALAQTHSNGSAVSTTEFLREAARSDRFEIEEGRLAQKMAHDPQVKAFAARMIRDHTNSTAQLKAAAKRARIQVGPPPPLTAEQRRMMNMTSGMAKMGGFDADYVNDQVMAHRQALALMSNYAASGSSAPLRAAAAKIVPVIRGHLSMIEDIQRKMPKGKMGNMGHK